MSGKMGSGASHILEGIKRKPVQESQVDVKRDKGILDEPHNVNVHKLENDKQINVNVLQEAVDLAINKKQRISIWAPDIALIMWYLKLSTPMFSISDVAKKYIAEGLTRDYPELYRLAKEELDKSH
ncbi:MAG: hypothetical protein ABR985_03280 [Methanotrichaceae archaeon]|jgi:hypothetical protein